MGDRVCYETYKRGYYRASGKQMAPPAEPNVKQNLYADKQFRELQPRFSTLSFSEGGYMSTDDTSTADEQLQQSIVSILPILPLDVPPTYARRPPPPPPPSRGYFQIIEVKPMGGSNSNSSREYYSMDRNRPSHSSESINAEEIYFYKIHPTANILRSFHRRQYELQNSKTTPNDKDNEADSSEVAFIYKDVVPYSSRAPLIYEDVDLGRPYTPPKFEYDTDFDILSTLSKLEVEDLHRSNTPPQDENETFENRNTPPIEEHDTLENPNTFSQDYDDELKSLYAAPKDETEMLESLYMYIPGDEDEDTPSEGSSHGLRRTASAGTLNEVWINPTGYQSIKLKNNIFQPDGPIPYPRVMLANINYQGTPPVDDDSSWIEINRSINMTVAFDSLSRKRRIYHTGQHMKQVRDFQQENIINFERDMPQFVSSDEVIPIRRYNLPKYRMFECPLRQPGCPKVSSGTLLSHFMEKHVDDELMFNEIYMTNKVLILLQPLKYPRSKNVCVLILIYGGARDKKIIFTPNSHFNVGLPREFLRLSAHVPIFVMACRTQLKSHSFLADPSENGENVLALWLVTPHLEKPLHCHLTVFNRRMDLVRTCILQARGIEKINDIQDMLLNSKSYMRLTNQDLRLLTNDHTEDLIYMELFVREFWYDRD